MRLFTKGLLRALIAALFLCSLGSTLHAQLDLNGLANRIASGSIEEKRNALFQIRNLKTSDASEVAVPALRDQSEIIRGTAAFSILFLPGAQAARLLIPLLSDKSDFVRRETAYALGETGNPDSAVNLIDTLRGDKNIEVRTAAAVSLGKIADISAVDELTSLLSLKTKNNQEFLRRSAARSIGQIAQFLQTGADYSPEDFLPDKYRKVEDAKFEDLLNTYPVFKPAQKVLIKILENPREELDVRRQAAYALGEIRDVSAFSALSESLGSEDYYLVQIAKNSLANLKNSDNR